ncbi:MAG: flippase-like domain-containing protein [Bacteroidales bacterium]|nr:flippase-like domain-containing protein [Bacteroidales bacterium]
MAEKKKNIVKDIIKYTLMFILAGVLVYFAFRKVHWGEFLAGLRQTRWMWIVVFCLCSIVAVVLRLFRWRELLIPFDPDVKSIRIWDAINVGNLASVALPGVGELLRCAYVTNKKIEYDKSVGTMFCERLWDAMALILLTILALAFGWSRFGDYFMDNVIHPLLANRLFWWILGIVVVAIATFVIIVMRLREKSPVFTKIADSLTRLWAGITVFTKSKNKALVAGSTLMIWTMYTVMCYCIFKAMPMLEGMDMVDALFISMVGNAASVVPVPGSIGAYHYLVAASIGIYGHSWDIGILYATLNHEIHSIVVCTLGVISYFHSIGWRKSQKAANADGQVNE